jgi:transcriptional regulator with XRE-family HTH domain
MSRKRLRVVTKEAFASWLRDFMRQSSLRVRDVAARAEVSSKTVHEWLRGRGPLHPDHVIAKLQDPGGGREPPANQPLSVGQAPVERRMLDLLERLTAFLHLAEESVARSTLPPPYLRQLQERVAELGTRGQAVIERMCDDLDKLRVQLERELREYRELLETEAGIWKPGRPRRPSTRSDR